jgi:hypothetical protein
VDLESPKAAGGKGALGEQVGGRGASDGEPVAADGGDDADSGPAGQGGEPGTAAGGMVASAGAAPSDEPGIVEAWFAFDKQPEGASRGIYLAPANPAADHCVPRLTGSTENAKQPAFSDDGKFLAYASDETGTYQIYLLDLATGESEPLTDLPQGATHPTFSPNGLTIAFVTGDPEAIRDGATEIPAGTGDLMLLNVKTRATQLLKAADPQVNYPYFGPAFASNERLVVSNSYRISALYLDTQADPIAIRSQRDLVHGVPQEPAPSPDGLEMAFPDTCDDTLRLQTLEIDLGSLRSCTPASRDFRRDQGELSPDWGPFGFIAAEFAGPPHGILLINDFDLSNGGWVAGASGGRNPDWAPPSFHWSCSASAPD